MKDCHPSFYTYFSATYGRRASIWATCYRIGTIANTKKEVFNRKLKVVYLNNKQSRRLDYLLHVLLKLSRDIIFEAFRKQEVGKVTHRKCEINRRHARAKEMDIATVKACSDTANEWQIQSFSDRYSFYYVTVQKNDCDCQMRCERCNVCVHMYS